MSGAALPEDVRFVSCGCCAGEGRIEYGHPNAPFPSRVEICRCCGGSADELVDVEPVTLEDIEEPREPVTLADALELWECVPCVN